MFFFQSYAENDARRLVSDLFLFFRKAQYEIKSNSLQLSLIYFDNPQFGIQKTQTVCNFEQLI